MTQTTNTMLQPTGRQMCPHCENHEMGLLAVATSGHSCYWCDLCGRFWDESPLLAGDEFKHAVNSARDVLRIDGA